MNFKRITLIGLKEFQDCITSKRFLALLFLMFTMTSIYVFMYIDNYFIDLGSYSSSFGKSIFDIPKAMNVYGGVKLGIVGVSIFGSIIAILLGFDLITKERETGSMKAILSVPVYRDEIINGKALGGIIAIISAVTFMFILTLGLLLVYSIVPGPNELIFIFAFWLVTILYLIGIFVMSVMVSSFSRTSGMSFIYSLLLFLLITSVIYSMGSFAVDVMMGPRPTVNMEDIDILEISEFYDQLSAYSQKEMELTNLVNYVSIDTNYYTLSIALTEPKRYIQNQAEGQNNPDFEPDIFYMLGRVWGNILFLIAYPVVFFGIAYVRFMRMDLR